MRASSEIPALFDDSDLGAQLVQLLRAKGYSEDGVFELTGTRRLGAVPQQDQLNVLRALREGGTCGLLALLLWLGREVPYDTLVDAIAPMTVEHWERAGLVARQGKTVVAKLQLLPFQDWLLVADRPPEMGGEEPTDYVMAVGGGTRILNSTMSRSETGRALDLGTGCGVLALVASTSCKEVVAIDISSRAASFARYNVRINDVSHVRVIEGDMFDLDEELVADGFDRITAHPPLVISPSKKHIYRDCGTQGDEIIRDVVREAGRLLRPGGYAQIVSTWTHSKDEPPQVKIREWLAETGCDAWVVRSQTHQPLGYAKGWIPYLGEDKESVRQARIEEWLAYYREVGIEAVSIGFIVLRKRASGTPWIRFDDGPDRLEGAAGEHIVRVFEGEDFVRAHRDDEALSRCRFTVPPELRMIQKCRPVADCWQVHDCTTHLDYGLIYELNHDGPLATLIQRLDGKTELGALIADIASTSEHDTQRITDGLLSNARMLVSYGMAIPNQSLRAELRGAGDIL